MTKSFELISGGCELSGRDRYVLRECLVREFVGLFVFGAGICRKDGVNYRVWLRIQKKFWETKNIVLAKNFLLKKSPGFKFH